jgi:hypothetical protein
MAFTRYNASKSDQYPLMMAAKSLLLLTIGSRPITDDAVDTQQK